MFRLGAAKDSRVSKQAKRVWDPLKKSIDSSKYGIHGNPAGGVAGFCGSCLSGSGGSCKF